MNEQHNPWTIIGEQIVYDNRWIQVTEYKVINPSGGNGIYGKVHFKHHAIGILPLDEEGNTYLVGQYRFTLNQYSWEIPEGGGPLGMDTLEAAKRELLEETGLEAKEWTKLMHLHLSNSVSDEYAEVFLARGLTQKEAQPEETEQLVVRKLPFEEACQMVEEGIITDAIAVAALLKAKILLQEKKLKQP